MKELTITVSGTTGTGKTALCQVISEVCRSRGIEVSSVPDELSATTHFSELRNVVDLERALRTLGQDGLKVKIVEQNLARPSGKQLHSRNS